MITEICHLGDHTNAEEMDMCPLRHILTLTEHTDLGRRVEAGVWLLDQHRPDWWSQQVLDGLDFDADEDRDILTLLFPGVPTHKAEASLGIDTDEASGMHGFFEWGPGFRYQQAARQALTQLWHSAIVARRAPLPPWETIDLGEPASDWRATAVEVAETLAVEAGQAERVSEDSWPRWRFHGPLGRFVAGVQSVGSRADGNTHVAIRPVSDGLLRVNAWSFAGWAGGGRAWWLDATIQVTIDPDDLCLSVDAAEPPAILTVSGASTTRFTRGPVWLAAAELARAWMGRQAIRVAVGGPTADPVEPITEAQWLSELARARQPHHCPCGGEH